MQQQSNSDFIRINHKIKVPQVRVIDEDGTQIGVMDTYKALQLARDKNLDLVEINPKGQPPVCKIVSYGKFKFDLKKQQKEQRKNQKSCEMKELTFRPKTEENDLNHKLTSAKEFLAEGHKVKFTVRFRGREVAHPQYGEDKLKWILEQLKDVISNSTPITMETKIMSMIVTPK